MTFVAGARPNFMKLAALIHAARQFPSVEARLVHTGQHYDPAMSDQFFEELNLPRPDASLDVGSGSHAVQTARVMTAFDDELDTDPADLVVVVGDVNSTLACALVAAKRGVSVAHVEAGLRSGDRRMPEEINRVVTDHLSDWLFTTERSAGDNLRGEGIPGERIHFAGNVMIDTLLRQRDRALMRPICSQLGVEPGQYALATLHRPSNVDDLSSAVNTLSALAAVSTRLVTVLPLHPRTRAKLREFDLLAALEASPRVVVTGPLGYLDFLALMCQARLVFTDSGGIQEETTALGIPCLTFRDNTERPITLTHGTNRLVGTDPTVTARAVDEILAGFGPDGRIPELWDGHAADRILAILTGGSRGGHPAVWAETPEEQTAVA